MFEKLLSLLPYNPGLLQQMSFYSRRMREEASIRRTGLIFLALAFFIQFFAVLSPPQSTVASSDNDLITGGFSSAAEARQHCIDDTRGYQHVLHYYGISCNDFNNAETLTIHSSAENNQYYSVGHNPTGSAGETPVTIDGAGTLYWRHLSYWQPDTWKVLRVRNQDNKVFYVIYDCGNLVSVGVPGQSQLQTVEEGGQTGVGTGTPPDTNTGFTPTPVTPAPTTPTPQPVTPTPTPQTPTPQTPPCQYNSSIPATSDQCFQPCQYNGLIPATSTECKPCDKSINSSDTFACIFVHKSAANVTTGAANADGTTVKAGDVINYTLYAENKGKATVKDFSFQENLSDVLDYADITDLHGGTISSDKIVSWAKQDIKAGDTATQQVTVKVKDPIPQTPVSSSDPTHFDLIMTNVYGNTVNIKLPAGPAKQIETASTQLPNTGPGTDLFIAASIVIVAGYFYSRTALLARESELAVKEADA